MRHIGIGRRIGKKDWWEMRGGNWGREGAREKEVRQGKQSGDTEGRVERGGGAG